MSAADLSDLTRATREDLVAEWARRFGAPPPAKTGQHLMRQLIAYERQAQAEGGLTPALRRRLEQHAAGKAVRSVASGAQLVREWNGVQHIVDVVAGGFEWRGQRYRSLSAVAEAITGVKWSGPRFFGLRP
ncbi:MAG: DUF2924 domain-containing protein [Hyphomonadaceae bacterium]